jgi:Na+-translocating ferredoxin:NAD+ oxidoreductase subunit B
VEKDNRRGFIKNIARILSGVVLGIGSTGLILRGKATTVWQLDPKKCVQCGRCATECVLAPSAVKCVHAYEICGYCKLCGGYHRPNPNAIDTAAENQLCPTGAIKRTFIEDPFYEYSIDETLCIGCGKCVKGCGSFGNGSLYLQVRHNVCINCNECAIARRCPAGAFAKVSSVNPYIAKRGGMAP